MAKKKLSKQRGAAFIEYVVALGLLIGIFVIIGILMQLTAVKATKRSVETVKRDVPCIQAEDGEEIFLDDECL